MPCLFRTIFYRMVPLHFSFSFFMTFSFTTFPFNFIEKIFSDNKNVLMQEKKHFLTSKQGCRPINISARNRVFNLLSYWRKHAYIHYLLQCDSETWTSLTMLILLNLGIRSLLKKWSKITQNLSCYFLYSNPWQTLYSKRKREVKVKSLWCLVIQKVSCKNVFTSFYLSNEQILCLNF